MATDSSGPGFTPGERIELLRASSPDADLDPGAQGTVTQWDPDMNLLSLEWDDPRVCFELIVDPQNPESPDHPEVFDSVRRVV